MQIAMVYSANDFEPLERCVYTLPPSLLISVIELILTAIIVTYTKRERCGIGTLFTNMIKPYINFDIKVKNFLDIKL